MAEDEAEGGEQGGEAAVQPQQQQSSLPCSEQQQQQLSLVCTQQQQHQAQPSLLQSSFAPSQQLEGQPSFALSQQLEGQQSLLAISGRQQQQPSLLASLDRQEGRQLSENCLLGEVQVPGAWSRSSLSFSTQPRKQQSRRHPQEGEEEEVQGVGEEWSLGSVPEGSGQHVAAVAAQRQEEGRESEEWAIDDATWSPLSQQRQQQQVEEEEEGRPWSLGTASPQLPGGGASDCELPEPLLGQPPLDLRQRSHGYSWPDEAQGVGDGSGRLGLDPGMEEEEEHEEQAKPEPCWPWQHGGASRPPSWPGGHDLRVGDVEEGQRERWSGAAEHTGLQGPTDSPTAFLGQLAGRPGRAPFCQLSPAGGPLFGRHKPAAADSAGREGSDWWPSSSSPRHSPGW